MIEKFEARPKEAAAEGDLLSATQLGHGEMWDRSIALIGIACRPSPLDSDLPPKDALHSIHFGDVHVPTVFATDRSGPVGYDGHPVIWLDDRPPKLKHVVFGDAAISLDNNSRVQMEAIPEHAIDLAAGILAVSRDIATAQSVRLAEDNATYFYKPGRGGTQFIVGDDGSVFSFPTSRDITWGRDIFRLGIRDGHGVSWHQAGHDEIPFSVPRGGSPLEIAATVLGVAPSDLADSTSRIAELAATAYAHPVRGAGGVIVGDDGGLCCIPSYLSEHDAILLYRMGVRHGDSDVRTLRHPHSINSASCALALYQTLSTGFVHEAVPRVLTVKEVTAHLGAQLTATDKETIKKELIAGGPGTHVLIGWDRAPGFSGHWLNAMYDGTNLAVIDAQRATTRSWPPPSQGVVHWEVAFGRTSAT